jgi:cell fate (sporulation/competence/biofilm development) regulator YlbF (YheA/YmcA/DUF963 family)
MQTTSEETALVRKTKELCQVLLDEPNVRSIRQRIDTFMGDESSRAQYDGLVNKGQALQEKQQMSQTLSREEIDDFEQHREALLNNPVARDFLNAQEEMHEVQKSVHQYVRKALELGRVPTEEEVAAGECGQGGCHCH